MKVCKGLTHPEFLSALFHSLFILFDCSHGVKHIQVGKSGLGGLAVHTAVCRHVRQDPIRTRSCFLGFQKAGICL